MDDRKELATKVSCRMASEDESYYINLCKDPVRFEPVSRANNVFFDDANKQVFAVRSGGAMGVVMKGPDEKTMTSFRMEDRGDIISIKFSSDKRILAAQRSIKSVEFLNFQEDMTTDQQEYSQSCKGEATEIRGFVWTNTCEIVFITSTGLEHYQVIPEKRTLKRLKALSLQINWYFWMASSNILLISSGTLGNTLHPFQFKQPGIITRLPKFDVDLPVVPKPPKLSLLDRDVLVAVIYDVLYIVVLRHPHSASSGAEIVLYQLQKEGPARKTDILKLDMSGRFAVNIVDNLVMVHHQASKTSVIFDIKLEGKSDGYVMYHYPVLPALGIKPFKLLLPLELSHPASHRVKPDKLDITVIKEQLQSFMALVPVVEEMKSAYDAYNDSIQPSELDQEDRDHDVTLPSELGLNEATNQRSCQGAPSHPLEMTYHNKRPRFSDKDSDHCITLPSELGLNHAISHPSEMTLNMSCQGAPSHPSEMTYSNMGNDNIGANQTSDVAHNEEVLIDENIATASDRWLI
ncbi:tyrosine--tRNA ligase [Plakobranchus ocellatus]|uniref:Tyrosine--tRNA ligase n=1 Tax=Plakobranchus ocellatus TaxID=259542 RepID=A0AAV4CZE2_9GAST|nr:tyrosine--tRNA ligase [Plakobranchus ocellatus]